MTALTSPSRILSSSSSWVPSTRDTPSVAANAARICSEAGDPSRSAKPYDAGVGLPEKISPKITTKISGKAIVQNSAARSRMKLLRLARVSCHRAVIGRSVPKRPAGQGQEDVLERRPADGQVAGLGTELVAHGKHRRDRRRDVPRVEDDLAVLTGGRRDPGQRRKPGVV